MVAHAKADPSNLTQLVLCGGAGSRLGGVDKPLEPWRGKPLVEYAIESVSDAAARLISANRNLERYRRYGAVFTDEQVHIKGTGPLLGIYGGLERATTDWLLVMPGDTPLLERDWYRPMLDPSTKNAAVVAHDGDRQQHLHLLLHASIAPTLAAYLGEGEFAVFRFLERVDAFVVPFDDGAQFKNFNRQVDFEQD
jgi:molybdopterin-guanine dinucleotide biosynthesis protein A